MHWQTFKTIFFFLTHLLTEDALKRQKIVVRKQKKELSLLCEFFWCFSQPYWYTVLGICSNIMHTHNIQIRSIINTNSLSLHKVHINIWIIFIILDIFLSTTNLRWLYSWHWHFHSGHPLQWRTSLENYSFSLHVNHRFYLLVHPKIEIYIMMNIFTYKII